MSQISWLIYAMKCDIMQDAVLKIFGYLCINWVLIRVMGTSMGVGTFGLCPMAIWGYFWEKGWIWEEVPTTPSLAQKVPLYCWISLEYCIDRHFFFCFFNTKYTLAHLNKRKKLKIPPPQTLDIWVAHFCTMFMKYRLFNMFIRTSIFRWHDLKTWSISHFQKTSDGDKN